MTTYTLGLWTVQPGREDEFVEAWKALAVATRKDFPGAVGTLLRDTEQQNLFVSYGPWESAEQVAQWRASAAFGDGVGRIRGACGELRAAHDGARLPGRLSPGRAT